uniref:Protein Red n=2 Tax=Echinococcus granulosus TaxID=6210 RepID=A0A068WDM1_ECHGR|nr:Protein Red [Echinococcus granulosus]
MDNLEAISNPQPPPPGEPLTKQTQLSNSDFRKLLLTAGPRKSQKDAGSVSVPRGRSDRAKTHSHKAHQKPRTHHRHDRRHRRGGEDGGGGGPVGSGGGEVGEGGVTGPAPKYRDRARERREGKISSTMESLDPNATENGGEGAEDREDEHDRLVRTADYRAVAPTSSASHAAERRRAIEESKYFGGDMEHTHLVKGLDYVLLEKVRREIQNKEMEAEQQLDAELERPIGEGTRDVVEAGLHFKTRLAEGIIETLFKTNQGKVERNEFFQPGRMAYRVELEDEMAEFEVPATVIRSKADCPLLDQAAAGNSDLTTNDIVINKLAQIFAYTRAGRRQAKKAKSAKQKIGGVSEYDIQPMQQESTKKSQPIFEDAPTEYVPTRRSHRDDAEMGRSRGHRRGGEEAERRTQPSGTSGRYFEKSFEKEEAVAVAVPATKASLSATKDFIQQIANKYPTSAVASKANDEQMHLERLLKKSEISGYDECYPGFAESYDAMGDSDEETDFSKMDMGNKKGPVGRWDFETQEEYGDYMSSLEAMPRAAYQYGVKKPEGRKTRRLGGGGGPGGSQKNERAEVDRQLQQITSLINKRKQMAQEAGDATAKRIKY